MAEISKPSGILPPSDKEVSQGSSSPEVEVRPVEIPHSLSVRQLADLLQVGAVDIIKQLMRNGVMANINQAIDYETAATVVTAFGCEPHLETRTAEATAKALSEIRKRRQLAVEGASGLRPCPPVVTIMGHVNHGKTRLLDAIRKTNVMDTEAGGITQHIGAYQVEVKGQKITFLDTPGHEAFTAMRARGAWVTDIAILVVAADDGVMPQTLEAMDHARAAGVPIVVAINKIDKANANPELVKQQLADAGLMIEEWGGDVVCVTISAKEGTGISDLLENLLVVAEVENLQAVPSQPAIGVVIEAEMDKTKGSLATVLVQNGTLKVGDTIVVGSIWGRVKAMFNELGKRVRKAEPATPVKVLGLSSVPQVGDAVTAMAGERQARALIQKQAPSLKPKSVSLNNIFDQITSGRVKELNIILRTDVQGSIEPIVNSLQQLSADEVRVRIIHSSSGNITESDVMLAIASKGLIIGFSTGVEAGARQLAKVEHVSIRHYNVIYNLLDDVSKALKGMLEPVYAEVIEGRAEVRAVFAVGKKSNVAGVYVNEGKVNRDISVRVRRGEQVVSESTVSSLKRFKDDVKEVVAGYECGMGVKDFSDFQVGDILEFFRIEKVE